MKEQLEFIYRRHSVRKFTNAKIPQADFEALFEAATLAPSGVNIQNWQFVVIENPEQIKELAEIVVKKVHNIANRTKNEELKKENASLKKENTELKKSAETDAKELERLGEVNSVLEKEKTEAADLAEKSKKELEDYKAEHEKSFEENNNSIVEKRKNLL